MKADFYLDFVGMNDIAFNWFLNEINKGPCSPEEIEVRGKKVAMMPNF